MERSSPNDVKFVRVIHQKFLHEHGMTDGEPGAPPLLLLDLVAAGNEPFSPCPAVLRLSEAGSDDEDE